MIKTTCLKSIIFLLFNLIGFQNFVFGQNYQSGVYLDAATSINKMVFYTTNGKNYLVYKDYSYRSGDGSLQEGVSRTGMVRSSKFLNYTCGPFSSYCADGYFFKKNNQDYYFDELDAIYNGYNKNNTEDSLIYLYKKVANLPSNWELLPEKRIGEFGVINKESIYLIIQLKEIYQCQGKNNQIFLKLVGITDHNDEFSEHYISEEIFNKLNISKSLDGNLKNLEGKVLQLYFKWQEGTLPYRFDLFEDKENIEQNKYINPYEISLLDQPLNSKSILNYPKPPAR
jgi:hypothetical protein